MVPSAFEKPEPLELEPIATPNAKATDTPCPDIQEPAANAGNPLPVAFAIESGQTAMVQSQTEFIDLLRRVCPRLTKTASVLTLTWAGTTGSATSPAVVVDTYQRLRELRNFRTDENHGANVA
ncbi:hypothetical protein IFM51744_06101 [Aspergillus udagawae]|nr:hypothetical protein IFM51744_06101 [Aspergillus udagawae]